jgi:chromosomal replication initiation ATPase DnaA
MISKRGTENLPGDIAIYLVRRLCSQTLPCVGKECGIDNYSTVSSAVQRIKNRIDKDKYLQREVDDVRIMVLRSQKRA